MPVNPLTLAHEAIDRLAEVAYRYGVSPMTEPDSEQAIKEAHAALEAAIENIEQRLYTALEHVHLCCETPGCTLCASCDADIREFYHCEIVRRLQEQAARTKKGAPDAE